MKKGGRNSNLPIPGPGRDSTYDPSMNDAARKLALLGLNNEEMAEFFGVTARTLYNWFDQHPAFFHAVQEGKVIADANVADSLYKRATGEHVQVEKIVKGREGNYQSMKYMQYIPGDTGAAMNWLKNRQRGKWQDKVEHNHTGSVEITQITRRVVDPKEG